LGDPNSLPDDMWELDDRLIEIDMLKLEGDEANKVYFDLIYRAPGSSKTRKRGRRWTKSRMRTRAALMTLRSVRRVLGLRWSAMTRSAFSGTNC
jgi:hypothetical protein